MSNLRSKTRKDIKKRNIILFGPPGIGKSTVMKELAKRGYPSFDLENMWPDDDRFELPHLSYNVIYGGADLYPPMYSEDNYLILLFLSQEEYDARRSARDAGEPNKAKQRKHSVYEWRDGNPDLKWDKIFYADNSIVDKIIAFYESM